MSLEVRGLSFMSHAGTPPNSELRLRLDEVRRRLIRRQAIRALLVFALGSLVWTALCLGWLHVRGDHPLDWLLGVGAFLLLHIVTAVALAVGVKRQAPTPRQIALYVDEHHPELENLILTAAGTDGIRKPGDASWLIERVLGDPRLAADRLSLAPLLPSAQKFRFASVLALLVAVWIAVLFFGRSIWAPPFSVGGLLRGEVVTSLVVEPGDSRVRRGQNQVIVARTAVSGPRATLHWRWRGGEWQTAAMKPGQNPEVHHHLLTGIDSPVEYRVTWNGVTSPNFELRVWEPPALESIDLTYRYPDYLGLAPRVVPGGGNIAGVEGTEVELRVTANKPVVRAALVLASGKEVRLDPVGDRLWQGGLRLTANDQYYVELRDGEGETNPITRQYRIVVKPDEPPVIRVKYPRGDADATLLDEIPFEFLVEDDFGLADYGIQYQVGANGPVRISLRDDAATIQAVVAHTLALEEMDLKPGDLMTWSAWARDRRPNRGDYEGMGDLYFMAIRPFAQRYREARSQAGGMQGGAGGGALAEIQKQVLIATWNLRGNLARLPAAQYEADRSTVVEMELGALRQVEELLQSADSPEAEATLKQLSSELALAVKALEAARGAKAAEQLSIAAKHERAAYELILSDAGGEMQVARSSSMTEAMQRNNPADVNELELDRNRNFYEEESRPPSGSPETDAALERLRELAARQALINEEIARLISELESARTREERDEIRRRLERLKEEIRQNLEQTDELERQLQSGDMSPQELREAVERLDEARRQSTASLDSLSSESSRDAGDPSSLQQARAAGRRALDALQSLESELADRSRQSIEERLQAFVERFGEFISDEQEMLERMAEQGAESRAPGLRPAEDSGEHRAELHRLSQQAVDEFVAMMESAGDLAEEAEAGQPLVARKFGDWLRETSASGVAEDLEAARGALDDGLWDAAGAAQQDAHRKLSSAGETLEGLLDLLVHDETDAMRIALSQLDQLMESAGIPSSGSDSALAPGGKEPREGEAQDAGALEAAQGAAAGREADVAGGESRGDSVPKEPSKGGESAEPASMDGADATEGGRGKGRRPEEHEGLEPFRIAWGGEEGTQGRGEAEATDPQSPAPNGAEASTDPSAGVEPGSPAPHSEPGEDGPAGEIARPTSRDASASVRRDGVGGEPGDRRTPGDRSSSRLDDLQDWPVDPGRLLGEDFRDWIEQLRSAQAVLGGGDAASERLDAVALQMEQLRREYRRTGMAPRFDLFLEGVAKPLEAVAADLQQRLARAQAGGDLPVLRVDEIPAPYHELVAEYFEVLSGSGGAEEE